MPQTFTMLYNEQIKNMNPTADEWVPDLLWRHRLAIRNIRRAITNHGITVSQAGEKASSVLVGGIFLQDGIVKYNSYQLF